MTVVLRCQKPAGEFEVRPGGDSSFFRGPLRGESFDVVLIICPGTRRDPGRGLRIPRSRFLHPFERPRTPTRLSSDEITEALFALCFLADLDFEEIESLSDPLPDGRRAFTDSAREHERVQPAEPREVRSGRCRFPELF